MSVRTSETPEFEMEYPLLCLRTVLQRDSTAHRNSEFYHAKFEIDDEYFAKQDLKYEHLIILTENADQNDISFHRTACNRG